MKNYNACISILKLLQLNEKILKVKVKLPTFSFCDFSDCVLSFLESSQSCKSFRNPWKSCVVEKTEIRRKHMKNGKTTPWGSDNTMLCWRRTLYATQQIQQEHYTIQSYSNKDEVLSDDFRKEHSRVKIIEYGPAHQPQVIKPASSCTSKHSNFFILNEIILKVLLWRIKYPWYLKPSYLRPN